jgi:hypothetical protein
VTWSAGSEPFVVGIVFYAVGALAMVFAQGLTAIIVFWAVLEGSAPRSTCLRCSC